MTEAEQIAADILQFVVGRVNVTTGTREDIANFIEGKVSRYMPAQAQLIFDARDHKGQREAIVKSLKAARSTGLMTDEIARLGGFNHTARISRSEAIRQECTAARSLPPTCKVRPQSAHRGPDVANRLGNAEVNQQASPRAECLRGGFREPHQAQSRNRHMEGIAKHPRGLSRSPRTPTQLRLHHRAGSLHSADPLLMRA